MIVNPDPLKYQGVGNVAGGTKATPNASPDDLSAWMQQQPWYQQTLKQWGDPSTLSLGQRSYLTRTGETAGLNPDYGVSTDGKIEDWSTPTAAKIGLAAFGAAAGGSALGAFGGGGGAAAAAPEATAAGAAPEAAAAGTHMGLSNLFGAGGMFKQMDPTSLLFGALSLFGGPQQQQRESFTQPGAITDPKQALYQALQSVYRTGQGLSERKPVSLRSSYVQAPPVPVNIPGIPFQIGGGLGRDPALGDPSDRKSVV